VKKIEEQQLANERQAGVDREARAESRRAAAQSETERIARDAEGARIAAQTETERVRRQHDSQIAAAQVESDRLQREGDARVAAAQAETDRARHENETLAATAQAQADRLKQEHDAQLATSQAEAGRLKQEHDAQLATSQAEADRLKQEHDAQLATSQAEADRLKRDNEAQLASAQAETNRLARENEAQRASAKADADRATSEKAQGEADKAQLRAQLLLQFNAILQTRDTARGLIVNMSDVLFDTAKFSLRPGAREKLAKVAGILSGHPSLHMQVEGYTDSVGTDDYNQVLSEHRAGSVRDYLTGAGIPSDSVTAKGFGKTQPVASNETSAGRQQNRRVELVISGEIIGADVRPSPFAAVTVQ
jgi:outer membrane protein OmpA-like peptidoglycan-associated protein